MANAVIEINVGGKIYTTTVETLCKRGGILRELFRRDSGWKGPQTLLDASGRPFLDRDPDAFAGILCYLRTGIAYVPAGVTKEQLETELISLFPDYTKHWAVTPIFSDIQRQPWFSLLNEWATDVHAQLQDSSRKQPPIECYREMDDGTVEIELGCSRCHCHAQINTMLIREYYKCCSVMEKTEVCKVIANVFSAQLVYFDLYAGEITLQFSAAPDL